MRYWLTFDAVGKRIVRFSSDLSTAMRTFSYSFALALVFKGNAPITLGDFAFDGAAVASISKPIGLFILLDLFHPFMTLIALHLIASIRFLDLKKYNGKSKEAYSEPEDRTELIFEQHPLETFGTSILPNILLISKTLSVGWTLYAIISGVTIS